VKGEAAARERIQKLLVTGDNRLKQGVDPLDVDALAAAMREAAALPCPNDAARAAAAEHDVRRQAERIEAILSRAAAAGRRA
jgi:hypothetical protein